MFLQEKCFLRVFSICWKFAYLESTFFINYILNYFTYFLRDMRKTAVFRKFLEKYFQQGLFLTIPGVQGTTCNYIKNGIYCKGFSVSNLRTFKTKNFKTFPAPVVESLFNKTTEELSENYNSVGNSTRRFLYLKK